MKDKEGYFGLFFFDIDDFSQVNNTYGHEMGDKVLYEVAQSVRWAVRQSDIVCRWGGEEFVGICGFHEESGLDKIGKKIKETVADIRFEHNGVSFSVTASVGVTLIRPDDSVASLIQRADSLMYHSKKNGKNRYTVG
jgi:diguanylate cyclase (GGDEF)-like protein